MESSYEFFVSLLLSFINIRFGQSHPVAALHLLSVQELLYPLFIPSILMFTYADFSVVLFNLTSLCPFLRNYLGSQNLGNYCLCLRVKFSLSQVRWARERKKWWRMERKVISEVRFCLNIVLHKNKHKHVNHTTLSCVSHILWNK